MEKWGVVRISRQDTYLGKGKELSMLCRFHLAILTPLELPHIRVRVYTSSIVRTRDSSRGGEESGSQSQT